MKRWGIDSHFAITLWWWCERNENLFELDPDGLETFKLLIRLAEQHRKKVERCVEKCVDAA